MTCVYCCKFYSTAWSRDVATKTYNIDSSDDRFIINDTDRVLQFVSQKEISKSSNRQLITEEIIALSQSSSLKEIMITGGEPFLYSGLHQLIKLVPSTVSIKVFSGLGIDEKRFDREIKKLPNHVKVVVSAESTGDMYEFIRYGNTWKRFNNNIEQLQKQGIDFEFSATVTNLTVLGLKNFINWTGGIPINFQACTDPDYLAVGVLDPVTKKLLQDDLDDVPDFVVSALEVEPTQKQMYNFKSYINEFAQRRSLRLDIFPPSLVSWLTQ
jgi:organic radical activating enzyme